MVFFSTQIWNSQLHFPPHCSLEAWVYMIHTQHVLNTLDEVSELTKLPPPGTIKMSHHFLLVTSS